MPVAGEEVRMKKLFMRSVLSLFLLSGFDHAEETPIRKALCLQEAQLQSGVVQLKSHAEHPDPRAYYLIGYASYKINYATNKYFSDVYLIDPEFKVSSIDLQ
jgi:hypothetical protein